MYGFHKICTINHYLICAMVGKWLCSPANLSKNIFSGSNFIMHIFSLSVTYIQSIEKIQEHNSVIFYEISPKVTVLSKHLTDEQNYSPNPWVNGYCQRNEIKLTRCFFLDQSVFFKQNKASTSGCLLKVRIRMIFQSCQNFLYPFVLL